MTDTFLCRSHPDFHMPEDVTVGEGFDGDDYCKRLKENHADAVVMFGKCHYGHAYYPSNFGTVHPGLKQDMMAAVSKGCQKHDLGFVGYYSVFLDTCAMQKHPDWLLQSTKDSVDAGFSSGKYLPVCVTSPYLEELMIPQCEEMLRNYPHHEMLLDTMSGFHPCYCDRCHHAFGKEIPTSENDPQWLEYVAWYRDQFDNFFTRTLKALHDIAPEVKVGFNWEWSFRRPADPPPHLGCLMGDLIAAGRIASLTTRYYAGTGLPYAYMTGRFIHGLGDWTSNTTTSIKHTAAVSVANGADFWIIDRQLPDGSLEDRAYDMMNDVFGFLDKRRDFISGANHIQETAALFSYNHVMAPDLKHFPDMKAKSERLLPFEGVNRLFMNNGRHYTAINETRMLNTLDNYRLVILPETEYISNALVERLISFVENGGSLLVTQSPNENGINESLLSLCGVEFEKFTELDYGYFASKDPLRISSKFALTRLKEGTEAKEICAHIEPLHAGKGGAAFGHGYAPPGNLTGHPAIVHNHVGQGHVIYIAAAAFTQYQSQYNPFLGNLILEQMRTLLPDPVASLETEALVELSALRKGNDLILHLVNNSGREDLAGYHYPVTTFMPEISDIQCRIKTNGREIEVFHQPSGQKAECKIEENCLVVTVPSLKFLSTLSVPDYFA